MNDFDNQQIDKASRAYLNLLGQNSPVINIVESSGNPARGSSAPTQVYLGNTSGWKFIVGDSIYHTMSIPHDWYPNGNFTYELHWYSSNTTAGRYIQWQIEWIGIAIGEVITSPGSSGTIVSGDILLSTVANTLIETEMPVISGTNFENEDHVIFKISRIASTGTAPAVGDNPVHIHTEINYQAHGMAPSSRSGTI